MDRTGQIFDGRYRLERLLGQGGMAAVYLARDRKLDKAVAVKVLAGACAGVPKAGQRFLQEARAISRVHHPNVVDVTDFGVAEDGAAYLVMELLRGEDLAQLLAREGPLPWTRVGPIALQICAALAAAHRVGVIHRDIKPSNCFRIHSAGNPDFIKVLDFGIARVVDPERRLVEPTTAGTVLGTPEYMAPELATGAEAGPASDLYAVGALIYKLLTGSAPFVGASHRAVLSKQIFEPPVPPRRHDPAIPEAVEALILRALAKDPAARHPDMAAFAAAIAETLPDASAVDVWLAPSTAPARDDDGPAPAAREDAPPAGGSSLAPTRTLARASARTVRLPPRPAPSRRRSRLALALALPLALAPIGLYLALAGRDVGDVVDQTGLMGHEEKDMSERTIDARRGAGAGEREAPANAPPPASAVTPPAAGEPAPSAAGAPHGDPSAAPPDADSSAAPPAAGAPNGDSSAAPPSADSSAAPPGPGKPGGDASAGALDADPPAESSPAGEKKAGPAPSPRTGAASGSGRAGSRRSPSFDATAVRQELARAAARVQRCGLDADMMRGEIVLRVVFAAGGELAAVSAAPRSRAIDPAALACIRRELAQVRAAAGPGEVEVTYVL